MPRYNRGRYARGRYRAAEIGPPSTYLAPNLLAAIQDWYEADAIAIQLAIRLFTRRAPETEAGAYLTVRERSSRMELRTSTREVAATTLEVRSHAPTLDLCSANGDAFLGTFAGETFRFQSGQASPMLPDGEPKHELQPGRGRSGAEVWYQERQYTCRVVRART